MKVQLCGLQAITEEVYKLLDWISVSYVESTYR